MQRSMKLIAASTAAVLVAGAGLAAAVKQPDSLLARPALEVASGPAPRAYREVRTDRVPRAMTQAWGRLRSQLGQTWVAQWDVATGVPNRIWGAGEHVPGATGDAMIAAAHAIQFLARHIDLLAPGAAASDFVLVSNVVHRGMRSIGFAQTHQGMPVLGGQVSFRYKNDRLFVIGSEALPNVTAPAAPRRSAAGAATAATQIMSRAQNWIVADVASLARADRLEGPFVLPIVGSGSVYSYATVMRVVVDASAPRGSWDVYVDADTGAPIAREQTLHFADGTVRFNVPIRYPADNRQTVVARNAQVTVNGTSLQTNSNGIVTWLGTTSGSLVTSVQGPLVKVDNAAGAEASATFTISPGGSIAWDGRNSETVDAQLTAFIHARVVKEYARGINPDLGWLDETLPVNVNISDTCNAFSDGNSINFFVESDQCANTGRLADVVYHEFGHSFHANSVIEGVGAFTSAHSEGLSDYLAATITNDPAMGRGFFKSDGPLRHIDPTGMEHVWPIDVAGPHYTGLIFAGAMWDLRKMLVTKYGQSAGVALADQLYYATLQRATGIPSTYVEVLAEDDNDGDLSNGTPNACDINSAFAVHGLRSVSAEIAPLSAEMPSPTGHPVQLRVTGLFEQCPGDRVAGAEINWRLRDSEEIQTVAMTEAAGEWTGAIPQIDPGKVVRYSVKVTFSDGLTTTYPDNPADAEYEFFVGEVVPLYCTGFETDPFQEGWTHGLSAGEASDGADDWSWGAPAGGPESGDPNVAFEGEFVIGNDLGGGDFDGLYQPEKTNFALTPEIDLEKYSDVHIQYWRWLNIEDGFFDQATVFVNDQKAWQNYNSDNGNNSSIHHQDQEWRFHDVPISQFAVEHGNKAQIRFEITSDGGFELGGWTMDDFCVMAFAGSICGDGQVTGVETCDEGDDNSDSKANACRETCIEAFCGDGVKDQGESCDDGNTDNDDDCDNVCGGGIDEGGGCGCEAGGRNHLPATGTLILCVSLAMVWVGRRRRRRR